MTADHTMPLTLERLAALHPRLYHMASLGSWPSIQRHGLLSTAALLELYAVPPSQRELYESQHRPEIVPLRHSTHGTAELRDQKPMSDNALRRALRDDLTPADWYRILNARVFFWTTPERLASLLAGRAYRDHPQTILVLDTASLLAAHAPRVELSPINSGSTVYDPAPRGRDTFLPIAEFRFDHWAKKRRSRKKARMVEPQVEVTAGTLHSKADFVLRPVTGPRDRERSIVVYLDGWEFHKDNIGFDLALRTALQVRDGYGRYDV